MIRLAVANFAGVCFLIWAWWMGFVHRIVEADGAHMTSIIAVVFVLGVVSTFWQARKSASKTAETDSAHLYDIFAALFILGIVGNAIGFLMAFGGIDIGSLDTPDGIRKAGAQLLAGSGTAFGSTIVGLSLALWTSVNLRILATMQDRARG